MPFVYRTYELMIMKYILLSIVFLTMTISGKAQWEYYDIPDLPTKTSILNGDWADSLTFVCTDGVESFFISNDAGKTFSIKKPDVKYLGNISQITSGLGYTFSWLDNRLYRTTNAWDSADEVLITDGIDTGFINNRMLFIHFWDSDHGFVVGDSISGCLEVWTTDDGGMSWLKKACDNEIAVFVKNGVYAKQLGRFQESSSGGYFSMFYEEKYIFKISDYGKTWKRIEIPFDYRFVGIFAFKDDLNGIIGRDNLPYFTNTKIARTTDGGLTWDTSQVFTNLIAGIAHVKNYNSQGHKVIVYGQGFFWQNENDNGFFQMDTIDHDRAFFYNSNVGVSLVTKYDGIKCLRVFNPLYLSLRETHIHRDFNLYPNPSDGTFRLKVENEGVFYIYTMDGRKIQKIEAKAGLNEVKLELDPGIYILSSPTIGSVRLLIQ